jgi:hypothetical protein
MVRRRGTGVGDQGNDSINDSQAVPTGGRRQFTHKDGKPY